MNYKEIKKKYPKAWLLLKEWFGYKKDLTVSMTLSKIFMPERRLYDFFDEQEIIIIIYPWFSPDEGDEGELYCWCFGINSKDKVTDIFDPNFKVRSDSEKAAFLKAFEILENKL